MKKNRQNVKKPIGPIALLGELKRSIELIDHYLNQIIKERKLMFGMPLSVELRRLYLTGNGNLLLERIEKHFNVKLKYSVVERPPDKYKEVGLKEYIEGLAFVSNGKPYSRRNIISLVADQRGAHTDENMDLLHFESPFILLPWGNPAKTKLLIPQDLHVLMQIGMQTVIAANSQLRVLSIN